MNKRRASECTSTHWVSSRGRWVAAAVGREQCEDGQAKSGREQGRDTNPRRPLSSTHSHMYRAPGCVSAEWALRMGPRGGLAAGHLHIQRRCQGSHLGGVLSVLRHRHAGGGGFPYTTQLLPLLVNGDVQGRQGGPVGGEGRQSHAPPRAGCCCSRGARRGQATDASQGTTSQGLRLCPDGACLLQGSGGVSQHARRVRLGGGQQLLHPGLGRGLGMGQHRRLVGDLEMWMAWEGVSGGGRATCVEGQAQTLRDHSSKPPVALCTPRTPCAGRSDPSSSDLHLAKQSRPQVTHLAKRLGVLPGSVPGHGCHHPGPCRLQPHALHGLARGDSGRVVRGHIWVQARHPAGGLPCPCRAAGTRARSTPTRGRGAGAGGGRGPVGTPCGGPGRRGVQPRGRRTG
jgi:hypothetical protein